MSIAISHIDTNLLKRKIEAWIFENTGERLVMEGPIQFHLFPKMVLEAQKVSLKSGAEIKKSAIKTQVFKIYPKFTSLFLGKITLTIEMQELEINTYLIKHFETKLRLTDGIVELFGSKLHVAGTKIEDQLEIDYLKIDTKPTIPHYILRHHTNRFPLSTLLKVLGTETKFTGNSSLNIELVAEGKTIDHVKNSISGQFELAIEKGNAHGLDVISSLKEAKSLLQSLSGKLSQNLTELSNLIVKPKEPSAGVTPYEHINVKATINRGIIHQDFNISHDHYQLNGKGKYNFAANSIDYQLEARYLGQVRIKNRDSFKSKLVPLKIYIKGNPRKPNIKTDINSYFKYIQQKKIHLNRS